MAHDLNPSPANDFGSLAIHDLLPERPALIGEFSLAYEAFRAATIADLAPVTKYEYLQAKASAEVELSTATERTVRAGRRPAARPQRATPQQFGLPAPLGEADRPREACAPHVG